MHRPLGRFFKQFGAGWLIGLFLPIILAAFNVYRDHAIGYNIWPLILSAPFLFGFLGLRRMSASLFISMIILVLLIPTSGGWILVLGAVPMFIVGVSFGIMFELSHYFSKKSRNSNIDSQKSLKD